MAGIDCPPGVVIGKKDECSIETIEFPCVVKAATTENSIGMSLVHHPDELETAIDKAFQFSQNVIIDRFIEGREFRCSIVEKVDQNGKVELIPMIPQEYQVRSNDLRTTEDKLLLDDHGLPLDKASSTRIICTHSRIVTEGTPSPTF